MTGHRRTAIFNAVLAFIAEIPDFSGPGKVARARVDPVRQEDLPAVSLTWSDADEAIEIRPQAAPDGGDGYDRLLDLAIYVHLRAADPDTEFDRLAALIEARLGPEVTLGGIAIESRLVSSRLFVEPQTGLPLGAGRLVYRIHYTTLAADPGAVGLI